MHRLVRSAEYLPTNESALGATVIVMKIDSAIPVQILDEIVCVFLRDNALEKAMN